MQGLLGGFQVFQGMQQSDAQKKEAQYSQGQKNIELQRQRLDAIRKARVQKAQAIASASESGSGSSSTVSGEVAGVQAQLASNLSTLGGLQNITNLQTKEQLNQINAQGWQKAAAGVSDFMNKQAAKAAAAGGE